MTAIYEKEIFFLVLMDKDQNKYDANKLGGKEMKKGKD